MEKNNQLHERLRILSERSQSVEANVISLRDQLYRAEDELQVVQRALLRVYKELLENNPYHKGDP
jgi:hypothetical protein